MEAKHTPTPWIAKKADRALHARIGAKSIGNWVAVFKNDVTDEDLDFIVRAVNSHDALVEALKIANKFCGSLTSDECPDSVHIPIRAALALAGEKP